MRKLLSGVLALILLLSLSVSAFGNGGISITIDGASVLFTDASGYPFIDANNRTLVPLRVVMEAYGCNVDWDGTTRTAIVSAGDIAVRAPIDQSYIDVNGQRKAIDTAAVIKNGRTYIPIRAVLEAFGAVVEWDGLTRTILVTSQGESFVEGTEDIVIDLASFIKECNAAHKAVLNIEFSDAFINANSPDFHDTLDLVSEAEAKLLLTPISMERELSEYCTKDEALKDVDLLFRVYKSFYGPYFYYGGDEVFGAAENRIVTEISAGPERFTLGVLVDIISRNLYFIEDRHMKIGPEPLCEINKIAVHDYYVENLYFYEDEVGYYTKKQNGKWYLTSVGGDDTITDYLKITIDEKGQLCYMLGFSVPVDDARLQIAEITLSRGEREIHTPIVWREFERRPSKPIDEIVTLKNNIPLLEINFNLPGTRSAEEQDAQQERVRQMGADMLSQDVFLLNANSGCGWQSLFESIPHAPCSLQLYRLSKTADYLGKTNMLWNQGKLGEYVTRYRMGKWGENDTLVFAVQDKTNFSAPEWSIADLRTMENIVLVGGSTGGTAGSDAGTNQDMILPNTRLRVFLGASFMRLNGYTEEGHCFEPDIWVNPVDAVDAIYRLCQFYGISNATDTSVLKQYQ